MPEVDFSPFVEDKSRAGMPTVDSVRDVMGTLNLGSLVDTQVSFMGQEGPMSVLISKCRIERLKEDWPKGFIAQVIGAAAQAAHPGPET
jgi:hypothetical protein